MPTGASTRYRSNASAMVPEIGRFRVNSADSTRNQTGPGRVLPDSRACASFSEKLGWTVTESADFPIFRPSYTESSRVEPIWADFISKNSDFQLTWTVLCRRRRWVPGGEGWRPAEEKFHGDDWGDRWDRWREVSWSRSLFLARTGEKGKREGREVRGVHCRWNTGREKEIFQQVLSFEIRAELIWTVLIFQQVTQNMRYLRGWEFGAGPEIFIQMGLNPFLSSIQKSKCRMSSRFVLGLNPMVQAIQNLLCIH